MIYCIILTFLIIFIIFNKNEYFNNTKEYTNHLVKNKKIYPNTFKIYDDIPGALFSSFRKIIDTGSQGNLR